MNILLQNNISFEYANYMSSSQVKSILVTSKKVCILLWILDQQALSNISSSFNMKRWGLTLSVTTDKRNITIFRFHALTRA